MLIQTVCGSGLGSSLLVEMNVKEILNKYKVPYEDVVHTNISMFNKRGVDLVVVGKDVAPVLDIEPEKKIILDNILSKKELEEKLNAVFHFKK